MDTRKSIRNGICLAVASATMLAAARPASGQAASPIRYVFGTNSFTDSTGQTWLPVPTSDLSGSSSWRWSNCARTEAFAGTPNPGLYREQIAEDSGDLSLTVPVPSGSYTVNLYFAEPCSNYTAGERVFGVLLNGATVAPSLDLVATAGAGRPVIESATVTGAQVVLDLKRIKQDPVIAAVEILPASPSYQFTAKLMWDDGTPVAGTVAIAQQTSTNPVALNSLGSFNLNINGVAAGSVNLNLAVPLTFQVTLMDPNGTVVSSATLFGNSQIMQLLPHIFNPSVVLAKSNAAVKSFSF
jgi:hypothetical protein